MVGGKKALFCAVLIWMGISPSAIGANLGWAWASDKEVSYNIFRMTTNAYLSDRVNRMNALDNSLDSDKCKYFISHRSNLSNFNFLLKNLSYFSIKKNISYLEPSFEALILFHFCFKKLTYTDFPNVTAKEFNKLNNKAMLVFLLKEEMGLALSEFEKK